MNFTHNFGWVRLNVPLHRCWWWYVLVLKSCRLGKNSPTRSRALSSLVLCVHWDRARCSFGEVLIHLWRKLFTFSWVWRLAPRYVFPLASLILSRKCALRDTRSRAKVRTCRDPSWLQIESISLIMVLAYWQLINYKRRPIDVERVADSQSVCESSLSTAVE